MAINDPNTSYSLMQKKWSKAEDLYSGLQTLRDKSEIYLPKESEETETNYKNRINRSVLFNVYRRSLQSLVGYAFSSPITISGAPVELEYLEFNADGTGRSITELAAEMFHNAIHYGKGHLYVDFPSTTDLPENISLPEYEALNLRPFFVPINPKSVIGWKIDYESGIEVLKNVRISQVVLEEDEDFKEETVQYIRFLTPDTVTTYRSDTTTAVFDIVETTENTLGKIPLLTVYSNKVAPMVAEPLLSDLVDLNLAHYHTISVQSNALHFARLPILLATGFEDADSITIASNTLIVNNDPNASLKFVELNGQSINSGRQHGQDIESYMSKSGAEILFTKSVSRQTASARNMDQNEALSIVQVVVRSIEQCLEQSYKLAGEWLGLNNVDVSVTIGSDLNVATDPNPATGLTELQKLFGLDDDQLIDEAKRRGLLASHIKPSDVNINNLQETQSIPIESNPVSDAPDEDSE